MALILYVKLIQVNGGKMTENKKRNIPQKGAAKKWSQRLKELGEQRPPKDLIEKLNKKDDQKKSASPVEPQRDLDI